MRVHPWIASILSGLALSAGGQAAWAQQQELGSIPGGESAGIPLYSPSPAGPGLPGYPAGIRPVVPPPAPPPSGAWDPIAAGQNGGPGYLPDQKPWPAISPFENRFVEHTNEGGLWFLRKNNSSRRYFTNVDYRFAHYERPTSTKVGSIIAPQTNTAAGVATEFLPVDTGVLYDSFLGNFHGLGGGTTGGGTGTTQNQTGGSVSNVAVNERHLQSRPAVNGFKIDFGFQEPTGDGMIFSGWYTPQAHWLYSRGFNATPQEIANRTESALGKPLVITNALPLNDGIPDGVNGTINGTYVTYDRLFQLDYQTVAGGGDMNWLFTPFWKDDWYQFAPTAGMQFLYIGEEFMLNAADSGGTVTFNVPPGLENPTSFVAGTPFESQIVSKVNSFLFGPQVGLRFQVGGDNLKLIGHSNFGLAMNHQRLELSSFGVGDPASGFFSQTARFHEKQEHTLLSPITSHEVSFQAHVFQYIPLIRKVHFLSEANFRIGYQIQAAYNVQRPNRTVQYNGFPLIPAIRTDQETSWYVQSYNFGVNWNY